MKTLYFHVHVNIMPIYKVWSQLYYINHTLLIIIQHRTLLINIYLTFWQKTTLAEQFPNIHEKNDILLLKGKGVWQKYMDFVCHSDGHISSSRIEPMALYFTPMYIYHFKIGPYHCQARLCVCVCVCVNARVETEKHYDDDDHIDSSLMGLRG